MMFASTDLARRIDRAESGLCTEIAAATKQRRPETHVHVEHFSGGVAAFAGLESPMNKMIAVGFDGAVDIAALERVEKVFASQGARLQAEVSTLADPAFHTLLCERGYVLSGFENVLGRALTQADVAAELSRGASDGPRIEHVETSENAAWASMLVDGFEYPDTQGVVGDVIPPREVIEAVMGDMLSLENLRRYVIRIDGKMISGASLRIDSGIAQLTGSATVNGFRRRGYQTAFVNARLADAARLGCDIAVVTTAPGSKSQQNLQKIGFSLLYSRALLVLQPK